MIDIPRQVLKNTSALAIARVARLVSNFLLVFLLARTLSVSGLGVYSTVLSYYGLVTILVAVGVQGFLTREIARDLSRTNRYMVHAGLITAVACLVVAVVFSLFFSQLGYSLETMQGFLIVNLALIPVTWMAIYESVFIAHHKAEYVSYTVIISLVGRISVSLYMLLNGYGVLSLLATMVVFSYFSFAIQTYFLVRHIGTPHWEFEFSFAVQMLKELRTFTAMGFLASVFAEIEILLLSFLQGEEAVGVYSAASKLIVMWFIIPDSYMRAVFPLMSQAHVDSPESFHSTAERSVKYLQALALPLAVGVAITADKIIYLIYGPDFGASIPVLRWLALLLVPIYLNEVLWRVLVARDEQHLGLRAQIAGVISKGGVSLLAVPYISYIGTVLAMYTTQIVYTGIHIFYVQRGGKPIRILHLVWRFALAAASMGVLTWLLATRFSLFIVVPLAIAFYGLLVILFKAFSSEDLALLRRLVRRREVTSTSPSQL
jgi:O-antigen/teichoic acid export membrane protein